MSYSPTLGRFLERDPAGYIDGPNLYQYVGSNPVNYVDPFGLAKKGVTVTADQSINRMYMGGTDVVGADDLSDLLQKIKSQLGQGDCLESITFVGHCVENSGSKGRGVQPVDNGADSTQKKDQVKDAWDRTIGTQYPPTTQPRDPLAGEDWLGTNNGRTLTAATENFFRELAKLGCCGKVNVKFYACFSGSGDAGQNMLQGVADIVGGDVTGYDGKVSVTGFTFTDSITVSPRPPVAPPTTQPAR